MSWRHKGGDTQTRKTEILEKNEAAENQFATRQRANDFMRLMRTLPDPDPILRKMGRDITALQGLLTDSHLESVWSVRCSAASGAEWFAQAGGEGRREKEAAEVFAEQLASIDVPRVIEEMMNAVAYGYSPLEVIWEADGGFWRIGDIVGKPPQWFEFDQQNRLVFKTGAVGTEELPANRFLIARHRPSYANPYGVKVFSKCYWPVTFKKNGFRWWTVFVEKYGGAFLYGKYPSNAGSQFKTELLSSLENMISDAVAIAPEGSEITIESLANKGSGSRIHAEYIEAANKEISKAVLGQTLTTDIGNTGSYAAAQAHNLVREDLAAADRRRISACFNRLAAVWTVYNFGVDVAPPMFEFVKDEDLQADRAKRDKELYATGWRPKKSYFVREYEMPEEDFDVVETADANEQGGEFSQNINRSGCSRGHGTPVKQNLFSKLKAALFVSKADKQRAKDRLLMKEFRDLMLEAGQEAVDEQIESYVDVLGNVDNFEDARAAMLTAYSQNDYGKFASLVDEVRFAAQGLGGTHGKR
jgi:phage gp29-like protein